MRAWSTISRLGVATLAWTGSLFVATQTLGQGLDRPAAAQRVVRVWTFDEPGAGVDPIPAGWFRAQDNAAAGRSRPGYPSYNNAILDFGVAASGEASIRLPTQGGSVALQLATGTLAAIPDADYVISARVRTQGLSAARARLSAWLVDEQREPLGPAKATGELLRTDGQWETITAPLPGHSLAAWIQIELELLQPEQIAGQRPRQDRVLEHDFSGAAWFDDVTVYQVPRLAMTTQSPINLIQAPTKPELTALVRDLTGEPLGVEIFVVDLEGREVDRHHISLPMAAQRTIWAPTLPAYGWYRAVMQVLGRPGLVGERHVDFAWLPPLSPLSEHERRAFGLIAESLPGSMHRLLPAMMRSSHLGSLQLAIWRRESDGMPGGAQLGLVTDAADRLLDQGVEVTFVLAHTPPHLASRARVDQENPLPVLAGEEEGWIDSLGEVLSKFGERVSQWQIGATGTGHPFFRPDLSQEVTTTHARLSRLVPRPRLALPWGGDQAMRADLGPVVAITKTWPAGMQARWASGLWSDLPDGIETRLVIEPIEGKEFGLREASHDLARRCVEAWGAGFHQLAIDAPWTMTGRDGAEALMPTPSLAVFIVMAQRLAGREIVGEFDVGAGVRALILRDLHDAVPTESSRAGRGALIAWNDSAPSPRAALRGYLGDDEIRVIDPFGNESRPSPDWRGHYDIPIDDTPVFIEGVDVELAQFRSALRIEPGFIPARAERHEIELMVENPWNVSITGRLRIGEPEDWSISPRVLPFNLDAGESVRMPIDLSFNLGEEAGHQQMIGQLELLARQRYPVQEVALDVEIGLPAVELTAGYRTARAQEGSQDDIVVTLRIANRSDQPLTLEAFAHAGGYRRDFRPISGLQPGESTMRFFRFPGGATNLAGKNVRVGIKEQDGTGRLNKTIRIDPDQAASRLMPEGE